MLAVMQQEQWHWTEAETEFKRTLELNPSNATAHNGLARWLCVTAVLRKLCSGSAAAANSIRLRFPALKSLGFYSSRVDTTKRCKSCGAYWQFRPDDSAALWFLGFCAYRQQSTERTIPVLEKTFCFWP